jgi:hypothetical protein
MAIYLNDSKCNSDDPEERASSKTNLDKKKCYYQVTEEENPQDTFCCSDYSTSAYTNVDLPAKFSKWLN